MFKSIFHNEFLVLIYSFAYDGTLKGEEGGRGSKFKYILVLAIL